MREPRNTTPQDSPAAPAPMQPRATLSPDYQRDWPAYFDAVTGKPPRDTLLRALRLLPGAPAASHGLATELARPIRMIDLACGEGRDTRAALAHDPRLHVLAIDSSAEGLARLHASLSPADRGRVQVRAMTLEATAATLRRESPGMRAEIINASFALPFCDPDAFPSLWAWIRETLGPGGVFAGQFFGDRDEWAPVRPRSHHARSQVLTLLEGFSVEHLEEVEKDGDDAMGGLKHHHVFHVVARVAGQGVR